MPMRDDGSSSTLEGWMVLPALLPKVMRVFLSEDPTVVPPCQDSPRSRCLERLTSRMVASTKTWRLGLSSSRMIRCSSR